VIGSTNPIWLDGDGDGQVTPARAYARQLLARHGSEPAQLIPALSAFDEAVASQAASLCAAAGRVPDEPAFARALVAAAPQVKRGFTAFAAAAR